MNEPKFESGQLVKIKVGDETRYNNVLEPVYNEHAGCFLYRLDEMMAMPVYREDWLEAVSDEEIQHLQELADAGKLVLHNMGYFTVLE